VAAGTIGWATGLGAPSEIGGLEPVTGEPPRPPDIVASRAGVLDVRLTG
jgi:hypothetical protein